jgi:hypothetical protein
VERGIISPCQDTAGLRCLIDRERADLYRKSSVVEREVGNTPISGGTNLTNKKSTAHLFADESAYRAEAMSKLIHAPVLRFGEHNNAGAGVYALMYGGNLDCYRPLRRCVDSSASIVEGGGYPLYVGSSNRLSLRERDHRRKLAASADLNPSEFGVIQLTTESAAAARFAEEIFLESLECAWNERHLLAGFGSKSTSRCRQAGERPSAWAEFHQHDGKRNRASSDLLPIVRAHIAATVSTTARGWQNRTRLHLVESRRRPESTTCP